MDTTYTYVGRQTNIAASGSCPGPGGTSNAEIKMSRSTNVLGQLMQTIDANGNTSFTKTGVRVEFPRLWYSCNQKPKSGRWWYGI